MKIDLSTIFLIIVAVIPGLFAQRSRNLVTPHSLAEQGISAELAELVALGISTHGILVYLTVVIFAFLGWLLGDGPNYFFHTFKLLHSGEWCADHIAIVAPIAATYIFFSFLLSHWLGFIYGVWRLNSPITTMLRGKTNWLKRFGVTGLLGERPIIYEVLNPELEDSTAKSIFVDLK